VLLVPLCPAIEEFQRSSSSRTCRNEHDDYDDYDDVSMLFNEPKLLKCSAVRPPAPPRMLFQCSSASRKFLNLTEKRADERHRLRFSAFQRAENSSIAPSSDGNNPERYGFSALQRAENSSTRECPDTAALECRVSVLFSEPKIPQLDDIDEIDKRCDCFSALQRAENSSTRRSPHARSSCYISQFQCSSASRKFLNSLSQCGN